MQIHQYPFSAIVGQEAMKTALLLNAVDPSIGGVLIRGHKGTAKSTAARALAALLPVVRTVAGCPYRCSPDHPELMHDGCRERFDRGEILPVETVPMPMVELPLSATEDRVVGTIHLEKTLKTGQRSYEPGLLAAANRGILYVDEVNLLEDHLVDLLLDAAASGINRVEREGLCVTHPARFMLIGTMNPEEGELRPQFLDRFGLTVTVEGIAKPAVRRSLVENRLAYEQDPAGFNERFRDQERFLGAQIAVARGKLSETRVPEEMLTLCVGLAGELKVHGHRADIALLKTARALAALLGEPQAGIGHIVEAAHFVLPHRLPGSVWQDHRGSVSAVQEALERIGCKPADAVPEVDPEEQAELGLLLGDFEFPGAAAAGSMLFETFKKKLRNDSSTSLTNSASLRSISKSSTQP